MKTWEDEFDERFPMLKAMDNSITNWDMNDMREEVKSFIRSLLSRTSPKMLEPINARELLSLSAEYGERSKFLEAIFERFGTGKMDEDKLSDFVWVKYRGLVINAELAEEIAKAIVSQFSRPDVVVKEDK